MSDPGGAAVLVLWALTRERWDDDAEQRVRARLDPHVLSKMPNFRRWQDVQMGLVGKLLLGRCLDAAGIDRSVLSDMAWTDSGRPSVPTAGDFNLTHADGLVACAFVDDGRVGIDVEPFARFPAKDLDQVLTENERATIAAAADPGRAWCHVWTFKEAVIKADGRGVAFGLERIDSHADRVEIDGAAWHMRSLDLHPEFGCHLATEHRVRELEVQAVPLDELLRT